MVFCFWFEWKGLEGRSQNESGTRFDRHRFVSETARALWNSAASRESEQKVPSAHQKETTIFDRRLSFLFVLFTFLFSFFTLLSNCRFQRKDKREKRREKVALLRKALNYIIICDII